MTKYLSVIFLLLVAVSGIRAQCSNNIPCTPQITGEYPSGYTNCPTNQSKICNGVTYNGNVNGTSVNMDLSSYYISGNNTYLTFTAKKCTVPFGASNNFSGANMTFKIVDAGNCVSIGSQTVSSSGSTVSVQVSLSNFNATKSFSGLLTSGSLNFYLGDITVTSAIYLDQVCITYATAPTPTEINLDWPNVSGSTEYVLQYRIGTGAWTPSTPITANGSVYSKIDCLPNTTYEFRIKAYNSNTNLQSCDFGYVSVTTPNQALPVPSNFTVSNNGPSSLLLNWSTVPNATGYEIQRDGPLFNGWVTVSSISSGTQSTWTDSGLQSSSTYKYRIRATNSSGSSAYSSEISATTNENFLPAPILNSVSPNGSTMNLAWTSGGGSVAQYAIYRKLLGGTYNQITLTCCATPTTYSDVNLSAGTYFYKIKAVDPNGTQGYESNELSNTINGTSGITSCTVSPNPVAIGGSLTINWSTPNNGGSNVKIELLSTSGATLLTLYSSTPNDGSEVWTVNNISAGIYQVKVSSISTPSNFATSSNLTISANQSQNITISVPNTTGLSYSAGGSIPITWSAVGVSGNYKVELITTSSSQGTILISNTTSPFSWSIPPTQVQGSNYKIRVTSLQTPSVFDESDNAFTITNSSSASCSCNTMTNPPSTSVEEFAAATYLCQKCIIDNPANGNVNPTAPVIKQDLAKMLYKALLGGNTLPAQYSFITDVIEKYPNPYPDMNGNSEYQRYGRVLLYLDYSNGVSPFTRRNSFYNPTGRVSRAQVCKAIVETFNIPIPGILTEPFTDVTPGTEEYKYICACYAKGIITGTTNSAFNPTASATRIQAMLMIYRYLNGNGSSYPPNIPPIVSISDFAMPDNYTPEIAGNELGLTDAMFNEYSQTSFSIPDKQMAIGFSHSYNSALSFLPAEYYGYNYISNITNGDTVWAFRDMRPLGVGWNHNYNAYIKKIDGYNNGSNGTSDDILVVVWPDGTMNYYQDNAALTKLTLGNFDQIAYNSSTGTYIITKKDQVKYTFKQTANTNSKSPFMLTRIEDRNGNAIALDYLVATGGAPRLNKVIAPSGRYLSFEYADNQTPKIKTVKDPLNRQVSFSYSIAEGLLGQYTDADNFNTTYNYLEIAPAPENWYLLSKVKRPEGNEITNTYDARRKLQSSTVVNSNGVTYSRTITNFGYSGPNPTNGTSGSIVTNDGANTLATSFAKNAKGDISTITTPTLPTGASILYNDPMYPTLPTQITANTVTTKYEYSQDNKGNVTKVIQDQGGLNLTHTVTYTALNDVATYQNPRLKTTTFVYGDGINLTAIQRPIGTTGITYLSGGLVDIVTNPEGIQTRFEYNGYGNVTKTTISGAGQSISTRAEYDAASRMIKSWDANDKLTQFEYNARDLPTKETNPLNYNTQFGYDKNGNLKQIINARGYASRSWPMIILIR
jgi:YD repeat-containing protein